MGQGTQERHLNSWVQLESHRLHLTGRVCAILEPDGEGPHPMH